MWLFLRHTTRLLRHQGYYKQGYYIKVYQSYYVTVTLTNHRPFQNRPTLDTKKMHFCSSESRESMIFGVSALKTIVLKNKTNFFRPATGQLSNCSLLYLIFFLDIADFVTSPPAKWCEKINVWKFIKIRLWSELQKSSSKQIIASSMPFTICYLN